MSLVNEYYNITEHEIKKLSQTKNAYWMSVSTFWNQVCDKPVDDLSEKQVAWLSRIEADLEDNYRPKWIEEEPEQLSF